MSMTHPLLIETEELAGRLHDPRLRLFDSYVELTPKPTGGYEVKSGDALYEQAHIPGAAFIDVLNELSDPHHTLRFMMPPIDLLVARFSQYGVGGECEVVLYNRGATWWATRVFFMLRALGFDSVRVLNGGLDKWLLENRAVESGRRTYPEAAFLPGPARTVFVDKTAVLAAISAQDHLLVNALSPASFSGTITGYGRAGRIAGSCNVYAKSLLHPVTQAFLPTQELIAQLDNAGLLTDKPVITYCGGGISATTNAFALLMLGKDNVTIYDASMNEWGPDASLPMECG